MSETTLNGRKVFKIVIPAVIKNYEEPAGPIRKPVLCTPQRWSVTIGNLHAELSISVVTFERMVESSDSDSDSDSEPVERYQRFTLSVISHQKIELEARYRLCIRSPVGEILNKQSMESYRFRTNRHYYYVRPQPFPAPTAAKAAEKGWLFDGDLHVAAEVYLEVDRIFPPAVDCMSKMLAELRNAQNNDFILVSADRQEIPTGKFLLGCFSPVFRAMLATECRETRESRCQIKDFNADAIKGMLDCILGADVNLLDFELLKNVFQLADKYEMIPLKDKCGESLMRRFDLDNVVELLLLADLHSNEQLKTSGFIFLEENSHDVHVNDIGTKLREANRQLHEEWLDHYSLRKLGVPRKRMASRSESERKKKKQGKKAE